MRLKTEYLIRSIVVHARCECCLLLKVECLKSKVVHDATVCDVRDGSDADGDGYYCTRKLSWNGAMQASKACSEPNLKPALPEDTSR
jgi:hypothetical protein